MPIDQRLEKQLETAGTRGLVDAVFFLHSSDRRAMTDLIDRANRDLGEVPQRVNYQPELGTMVVMGTGRLIRHLADQPEVSEVSAADTPLTRSDGSYTTQPEVSEVSAADTPLTRSDRSPTLWQYLRRPLAMLAGVSLLVLPLLLIGVGYHRSHARESELRRLASRAADLAEREAEISEIGDLFKMLDLEELGKQSPESPVEDSLRFASTLRLVANLHMLRGEHEQAESSYRQALEVLGKIGKSDAWEGVAVRLELARLHTNRGELDRASRDYDEAIALLRKRHQERVAQLADVLRRRGNLHLLRGDYSKAEADYKEALRLLRMSSDSEGRALAAVLYDFGRLSEEIGETDKAMSYFEASLISLPPP